MSLMPEFELGLWNAWIITVLGVIFGFLTQYINKEVADKRMGDVKWSEALSLWICIISLTEE